MTPDDFRRLVAAGLTTDQIAIVMEMMERDARAAEAAAAEADEQRKAKGRERWRRWKETNGTNVSKRLPTTANDLRGGDARVEVKTSNSEIEPQEKKDTPRAALEAVLDETRAAAVLEHRQRLRKPLTAHAAKLLAGKFAACPDPNAAADKMVGNGWQGFEPEWMTRPDPRGSPASKLPSAQEILKARRQESTHDERPPNRPLLVASR